MLFFFFSSRRRHTRYWRDWSSDVCSSDLTGSVNVASLIDDTEATNWAALNQAAGVHNSQPSVTVDLAGPDPILVDSVRVSARSEERRVGKECRSRWSPYH